MAVLALRHPTNKSTGEDSSGAKTPSGSTSSSTSSKPAGHSSTPAHASSSAANTSSAKTIPLVVLNNTETPHLAADAATLFEQAGWKITSSGNYQNNIISTCAYYDPSVAGAQAAADLLRSEFPSIVRVEPKFSGLVAGPIVVVLTPDFKIA